MTVGRRRVMHAVTSAAFAGVERHVLQTAAAQAQAGWEVVLVCPGDATVLRDAAAAHDIEVRPRGAPGEADTAGVLRAILGFTDGVLNVHDGRGALCSWPAGRRRSVTYVRTQHFLRTASMARPGVRGRVSRELHRRVNASLDGFIAVSESVLDAARARREVGDTPCVVIPPAIVGPTEAHVRAVDARRDADRPRVVCFCGRLEPERHLDVLISAIPAVVGAVPGTRFVLGGSGSAEAELRSLAAELDVEDHVEWPGWTSSSYELLQRADVYVNTWPAEAFGMAMAEAMSIGLPVVAADAGANRDLVEGDVTGLRVPPDDPGALAEGLSRLLLDGALRAEMGRAARSAAATRFGAHRTAAASIAFYESIAR